ncbi:NAD-dependent succinate-semialdehyde dehydrogenase [Halopenitus persicus]|uniref:Succinate-semialdehyde dehydrogenase / glutarate-semialdehyde dehydrogenase n=1 Tax=Halopenitus persicus TaxID=1048396 RepID=A0A1H3JJD4_9EURY|nr:NAD-dependent succinate-semialdehyde dehydrogenase [Halopenitus persicus]SDY39679.1 succinate-semialdehyde dehydrogenase / glutarate-semialdehyde dehydrogenase [Halopenitus persicus]
MNVVNPATGETVETYETDDEADVVTALDHAESTFESWRKRPQRDREELLVSAAEILRERQSEYAELITREMGKPITQAESEIEKCAWVCEHYAEYASTYLEDEYHPSPAGTEVKTSYEPLGPIFAVMPWNFPFWQVFRFAAPNLVAGNVGLLKHASSVPGCALAIEEVFRDAGFPENAFQTLLVSSDLVEDVIDDDRVKATTLTGSGPAGSAVAAASGERIKKSVLELGGSDPFVVLDDADLETTIEKGVRARNQNSGQSCIAAKRFIVHDDVYDEFVSGLVEGAASLTVGDPTDPETDVGPQASAELLAELHDQVERSVAAGATVETGGEPLDRDGAFYPPTVLTDVPDDSPAARDELFGPVAAVFRVDDESEAMARANDTRFGLGGSVWTTDRERGERLAHEIEAGCVYVNRVVGSDPRVPFGGVGVSGFGRELSEAGIKEFVNRKTIWVQ